MLHGCHALVTSEELWHAPSFDVFKLLWPWRRAGLKQQMTCSMVLARTRSSSTHTRCQKGRLALHMQGSWAYAASAPAIVRQ